MKFADWIEQERLSRSEVGLALILARDMSAIYAPGAFGLRAASQ